MGRTTIDVMDNAGNVFQVPIKNLRSPFKSSIDVHGAANKFRYDRIINGMKANDKLPPIYVNPGGNGVKVSDIILKP